MLNWLRRAAKPVAANGLSLSRPWARPDAAASRRAGGYVTIANGRAEPDRLLAAESPLAEKIEIHAIKVVGADIRMRPLPAGLVIPAQTTIELKPRGYHLLIDGLPAQPAVGTRLPVTLVFEKAGRLAVELVVEKPGVVGSKILDLDPRPVHPR